MILPRLLGIRNYHTQKSCAFHLTNYVRSQGNTAATEAFNLPLLLFSSSRSSFRPLQLVSEKPAPFHFSVKLWLELFLSPPSRVYSFPCPRPPSLDRDQHLGGSGGEAQDNTWGDPPTAWPCSPAHTCPGAGGRVQGEGSRPGGAPKPACARLNRAGTPGLRYIRYHPEDPEIISPLHNLVTGCRAGGELSKEVRKRASWSLC